MKARSAVALVVGLLAARANAQDAGAPHPGMPGLAIAYIHNNTTEVVRFAVSSGTGTRVGVLGPNQIMGIDFAAVGRPRILTAFSTTPGGRLLANRQVRLRPNYYYEILLTGAVPGAPEGGDYINLEDKPGAKARPPAVDSGTAEAPAGAEAANPSGAIEAP